MGFLEIAVIVVCSLVVIGVIAKSIIDKKKGKSPCGCDCSKCTCGCSAKENNEKDH
jgi:hypothetical protein